MKKLALLVLLAIPSASYALIPNPMYLLDQWPEVYCKHEMFNKGKSYEDCVSEAKARIQEAKELAEKKKQEEYLKSPEYKQKLLEEKQKDLEAKQAELEKKQKELEKKAEAIEVKAKLSPEAELAKSALGAKASILESLVPIIKSKDSETQQKVSLILETFKASKDEYTRNVGFYLSYLLE